jgi:hypothetical protein
VREDVLIVQVEIHHNVQFIIVHVKMMKLWLKRNGLNLIGKHHEHNFFIPDNYRTFVWSNLNKQL